MSNAYERPADEHVDWLHNVPFLAIHLIPFAAFFTGVTRFDVLLCIGLYSARMFFITGVYHRYFAHRSYKMGRVMQFLMAFGGTLAVQKGPLWWAAHHRHHHKYSDETNDVHSPLKGLFWSHMGWIMCRKFQPTQLQLIQDFAKYPELRLLNKYHWVPPTLLGVTVFLIGGWSALVIGFFLSTVLCWHCTYLINSLAHLIRAPALRHHRHQPQLARAGLAHIWRRLAQQPPLLSVVHEPGLLLVGDRRQLLRPQDA